MFTVFCFCFSDKASRKKKQIKAPVATLQKLFWSYHKSVLHHEAILTEVITYRGANYSRDPC